MLPSIVSVAVAAFGQIGFEFGFCVLVENLVDDVAGEGVTFGVQLVAGAECGRLHGAVRAGRLVITVGAVRVGVLFPALADLTELMQGQGSGVPDQ